MTYFHKILEALPYALGSAGIFGLDLTIKNNIEKNKRAGEDEKRLKNTLIIRKLHNKGAFLHMGQKNPFLIKAVSVMLTLLLTVLFILTFTKAGNTLLKTGYSLLLGGAFNNTYDRLKRGYVVDYVSFNVPLPKLRNIVFNISDFGIMIGAMLIVISSLGKP